MQPECSHGLRIPYDGIQIVPRVLTSFLWRFYNLNNKNSSWHPAAIIVGNAYLYRVVLMASMEPVHELF